VLGHEIGHALGLLHSNNEKSLIYGMYTGGGHDKVPVFLDNLDQEAIRYLYGRFTIIRKCCSTEKIVLLQKNLLINLIFRKNQSIDHTY